MAGASGYSRRGRGRGGGRGYPRSDGYSRRPNQDQFKTSDDGTRFCFPTPWNIKTNPTLMENFTKQLKCFGGYSEDEDKNFCNDNSVLNFLNTKYLPDSLSKVKSVSLDLTTAEEKTKPYTGTPLKTMHNFFSWILSNDDKFLEEINNQSANDKTFVFAKSVISRMLRIPYAFRLDFAFYAVCVDNIIYLMIDDQVSDNSRVVNDYISNWAHKFEQCVFAGEDTKEGVASNSDFRCVLSSKLGSHKLIYSSSVDCFNPDLFDQDMNDLSACVYLKCIYESEDSKMKNNLERFKMLAWCGELTLTGAPHVLLGFRDTDGMVDLLKLYTAKDLSLKGKEYWDINVCFAFVDKLLSYVKEVTESKPSTTFHFAKPASQIFFTCSERSVEEFPPQWFIDEIQTMGSGSDTSE